ncbi:MAG TPA: tetratricopeptide repeat protein [Caldilineaceae bacterium]|nr:tetratricopeptide repeat protein [Caldilineaceae bacterium]
MAKNTVQPQAIFTSYMIAGLTASLQRVQSTAYVLPEVDRQQAWHLLSFALKVDETWPATRDLLLALMPKMEVAGHWEGWIPYLIKGVSCSQSHQDDHTAARLMLEVGYLFQRLDRLAEAEEWLCQALAHFQARGESDSTALTFARLANVARNQMAYDRCEHLLQQGFACRTTTEDVRAFLHLIAGHLQFDRRAWDSAEEHYKTALALWKSRQDDRRAAISLQNLGRVAMMYQNYEKALRCYSEAAETLRLVNDPFNGATVDLNIGIVYSLLGSSSLALAHYAKAKAIFLKADGLRSMGMVYNNEGIEYSTQQRWSEAQSAFQNAIAKWQLLNDKREWANSLDGLGLAYANAEQPSMALQAFNEALTLLDTTTEQTRNRALYETIVAHRQETQEAQTTLSDVMFC